jgi:hypothetical protein
LAALSSVAIFFIYTLQSQTIVWSDDPKVSAVTRTPGSDGLTETPEQQRFCPNITQFFDE